MVWGCLRGIYTDGLGLPKGKMFWSSEDRVKARFHYAESRQNKPQVNLGGNLLKEWPGARN